MSKYQFGSIVDRDFRNTLQRLADDAAAQGKAIQDLVAEGQLTEEQYAELISAINQHVKSGDIDKFDLTPQLRSEIYKIIEIESKLSSGININDLDEATRQAFLEAQGIDVNYVLGPRNVGNINLKDDAITPETVGFINKSTNLFNEKTQLVGQSIDGATGEWGENAGTNSSELIRVKPNTTYSTLAFNAVIYFDDSGEFDRKLWLTPGADTFETHENTHFVRVQYQTGISHTPQLNEGSELLDYEKYKLSMPNVEIDTIQDGAVGKRELKERTIDLRHLDFIEMSTNLIDEDNLLRGYSIDPTTGEPIQNNSVSLTDGYIEVKPNTTYSLMVGNYSRVGFFSEYERYVGSKLFGTEAHKVFTTDGDIKKVRIAINRTPDVTTYQMNEGAELLPYEPFYIRLKGSGSGNGSEKKNVSIEEFDKYIIDGDTDRVFSSPEIPEYEGIIRHMSASEYYGYFDELVNEQPDYITKRDLGFDSSGEEKIYSYRFRAPTIEKNNGAEKVPKIILISGVHGNEETAIINVLHAMQKITRDWRTDDSLKTLRWNAEIIVLPLAVPWCFTNDSSLNFNGVNIARNFPEEWWDGAQTGEYPLSEIETQVIANLLDENKEDTVWFASHHNFSSGSTNPEDFIWNAAGTRLQMHVGTKLVHRMTNKWKSDYAWLPEDESLYFGNSSMTAPYNAPPGSEAVYARSIGIHGATFETSRRFGLEEGHKNNNSLALTMGVETLINYLILGLRHGVDYYNNHQSN